MKRRLFSGVVRLATGVGVVVAVLAFAVQILLSQSAAPDNGKLSPEQLSGKGVFLQRCSLCHLPQLPGRRKPFGPLLTGLLKDATEGQIVQVRERILDGSTGMPGFRYGLEPREIDDVLSYLKTF